MRYFSGLLTAASVVVGLPATAAVVTYVDQAAFEAAVGVPVITEEFDGAASDFAPDSMGNAVGSGITIDVNGPAGSSTDTGPTGLTGNGQLESEVDSSGDILTIGMNFAAPVFGFGFVIQNDSQTTASGLDLEEIGILLGGESFILSDILGLSDSSDGNSVSSVNGTGPQFFGFISDTAFSSLEFVHGDDVAPGGVSGGNEEFYLNSAVLAPAIAAVPLPAGLPLLLVGLGGMALVRGRRKA